MKAETVRAGDRHADVGPQESPRSLMSGESRVSTVIQSGIGQCQLANGHAPVEEEGGWPPKGPGGTPLVQGGGEAASSIHADLSWVSAGSAGGRRLRRQELFLEQDLQIVLAELFRSPEEMTAEGDALSQKVRHGIDLLETLDDRVFMQVAVAYSNDRRLEGGYGVGAIDVYLEKRLARPRAGQQAPRPKKPLAAWKRDAIVGAAGAASWIASAALFFSVFTYESALLPVLLVIGLFNAALTPNIFRVTAEWLDARYSLEARASGH